MPARVKDAERVLRGVSFILQEYARIVTPELRVHATNVTRHAQELTQLAKILPSAVADARRAAAGALEDAPPPPVKWRLREEYVAEYAEEDAADTASPPTEGSVIDLQYSDVYTGGGFAASESALVAGDPAPKSPSPSETPVEGEPAGFSARAGALLSQPSPPAASPDDSAFAASSAAAAPTQSTATPAASSSSPRSRRKFRELAVPASPIARLWGFGSLAGSLLVGAAEGALSGSSRGEAGATPAYTAAQAERLAEGLCRMRGAALKIGQMLSLLDEDLLPPAVTAALERVRTQADVMPPRQLEAVMRAELGPEWRARLGGDGFEAAPIAAASIGQVHRATLADGRRVAIKVQYPGVADSINSDIGNLRRLLKFANVLPKGLYVENIMQVARDELAAECDYEREAACQERFRALLADDDAVVVPAVVRELSTRRVLVTEWLEGAPIDQAVEAGLGQAERDSIARTLLKLTLRELFEWRFMQTDPNWGNFFYDARSGRVGLLDFGASRDYPKSFVDDYLRLVWAAANGDRRTIEDVSVRIGFLTGLESPVMREAHVTSGLVVGEPFMTPGVFDFRASGMTARLSGHLSVFSEHRLTPPPDEVYSLHRKLAGAFLICIRMGARIHCRDLLEEVWNGYRWGASPAEGGAGQPAIGQLR